MIQIQHEQILLKSRFWKFLTQGRDDRVAQVVKCLHSNCDTLTSNPRTKTKEKNECKRTNIVLLHVLQGRETEKLYLGILFHQKSLTKIKIAKLWF
jgi:hypothetical protein